MDKLDFKICNSAILETFKKQILNSISYTSYTTHWELNSSHCLIIGHFHLKKHVFEYIFQDSIDPFYCCGNNIESTF